MSNYSVSDDIMEKYEHISKRYTKNKKLVSSTTAILAIGMIILAGFSAIPALGASTTIKIDLHEGINFVALSGGTASAKAGNIPGCQTILRYDPIEQRYKNCKVEDFLIEAGAGYYLRTTEASTLKIKVNLDEQLDVPLLEGYNLIAHYGPGDIKASEIMDSTPNCVEVKSFDGASQTYLVYSSASDLDFSITPGMGYFVKIEKDDNVVLIPPTDDTYIRSERPNVNYGLQKFMRNKYGASSSTILEQDSLLSFDISSIPEDACILSAELSVFYFKYKDNDPSGIILDLHKILDDWDEEIVTWNTAPVVTDCSISQAVVPSSIRTWMEFDVTDDIQHLVDATPDEFSCMIKNNESWSGSDIPLMFFATKEYGLHMPYLKVVYDAEPPETTCNIVGLKGKNGWYRSDVTVTLDAVDDLTGVNYTMYRVDAEENFTMYSGPFVISGDRVHRLQFFSVDFAGNTEAVIHRVNSIFIKIDTVKPVSEHIVSDSPSPVVLDASDNIGGSGLDKILFSVDGSSFKQYTGPVVISTPGEHIVKHYSVDLAGNKESVKSFTVNVPEPPETPMLLRLGDILRKLFG